MNERLDSLEAQLSAFNGRLYVVEGQFRLVENNTRHMDRRFDELVASMEKSEANRKDEERKRGAISKLILAAAVALVTQEVVRFFLSGGLQGV